MTTNGKYLLNFLLYVDKTFDSRGLIKQVMKKELVEKVYIGSI